MKIAIIGQGYVGKAFKEFISAHFDYVTYDPLYNQDYPAEEINECDFAVICVPTPMNEDGSCDVSIVEEAIGKLKNKRVLIKSTVAPGTTDRLARLYGKSICFSPEYIGESTYLNSFYPTMKRTPFLIVGGEMQESAYYFSVFEHILGPEATYHACTSLEAELIKYMENSFLAAKVLFVNEFYDIVTKYNADWHRVREGWLLDQRIGRSSTTVFRDKRGFSGKCLPKDTRAIVYAAEHDLGYVPEMMKQVIESNKKMNQLNG
jgi:nucleotide sugar dehydrogenase